MTKVESEFDAAYLQKECISVTHKLSTVANFSILIKHSRDSRKESHTRVFILQETELILVSETGATPL